MHGQMIGGYRILERIAAGGQGTVYRAEDPSSGEVVALKVLHPYTANDPNILQRFLREAEIAKSIDHRNVVRILEVGQDSDQHFITMEYLPRSVRDIIDVGRPTIAQAIKMCMDAARGLQAASDLGIVHRDIKPDNLLIDSDDVVKVSDFGIARDADLSTITAAGAALGTVRYMSPEQALGERADVRSDIYSLGVTLYELLAGSVPFHADTLYGIVQQHIKDNPPPVRRARPEVTVQIERIVSKCLEKDPDRRFQTPGNLALALTWAFRDLVQRNALKALYNATDGANWAENDNWLSYKPLGEWHGVTTNDERGNVIVIRLDLSNNQLRGSIPPEISNLTSLNVLDLSHNQLSGNIPPEIGNLTWLKILNLSFNDLSGSIPHEIIYLIFASLERLDLKDNQVIPPHPLRNKVYDAYAEFDFSIRTEPTPFENLRRLINRGRRQRYAP